MRATLLFWLAALLTLAHIGSAVFADVRASPPAAVLALLLGAAGALFAIWPFAALVRQGRVPRGGGYMDTRRVVDRGPYAVVRHPQYLGYILLNLSFIFSNPGAAGLLLGLAAAATLCACAKQEERRLRRAFGSQYEAYARRVPAFNAPLGLLRLLV